MIRIRKRNKNDTIVIIGDIVTIKDSLTYERSGIKDLNLFEEVCSCFNYKVIGTSRSFDDSKVFTLESNDILIKPKHLSKKVRLTINEKDVERVL